MSDPVVAPGFGAVADAFFRTIPDDDSSGAAMSVWIDGVPVIELWGGVADARTGRPFGFDTLSVIFSCTKGLASVLIAMLIERGTIPSLESPVVNLWPEFGAYGKEVVTIGDALAHRAGLSAPRRELSLEDALDDLTVADVLAEQMPLWPPGEHHQYHTVTHGAITSKLVRLAAGQSISGCFDVYIAGPLQAAAWIGLPESEEHRVSRLVEDPSPPEALTGDPESIYWSERAGNFLGGITPQSFNSRPLHAAELAAVSGIASASGLAKIWSATVTPTDGVRLISDDMVKALREPRSVGVPRFVTGPPPYQAWGAGVMIPSDWQPYLSPTSFGHDGAGGQVAFADSDAKLGFAYLTNEMGDWSRGISVIEALARAMT
ncbi:MULTISPECIES: serine hydrolase domain-containing protein [unclassified Kribbella]|uniref:serine hydrolase domain-containing protein n=1 Tax=unclassified Kribbella TaxID=2644121 RepID=UPI0030162C76